MENIGGFGALSNDYPTINELAKVVENITMRYELENGDTALFWHLVDIVNAHIKGHLD